MKVQILGGTNSWGPNPFLAPPPPGPWPMTGTLADGRTVVPFRKYRTSLLVTSRSGYKILVDCGPDFAHQLRAFGFGVVDAILITHPHLDHIGGLDELNLYRPTGRLPIPTYATETCWANIRTTRGLDYVVKNGLAGANTLALDPAGRAFDLGGITVTPFPVEHNQYAPGAVGYVFEEAAAGTTYRVLYTGDFWTVSNPADPLFRQAFDVAVIECDRSDHLTGPAVGGGHMSFREVVRTLNDGVLSNPRPKQVVLVHFGDHGPAGTASTYQDWRTHVLAGLGAITNPGVIQNPDHVIGYEGLTLDLP